MQVIRAVCLLCCGAQVISSLSVADTPYIDDEADVMNLAWSADFPHRQVQCNSTGTLCAFVCDDLDDGLHQYCGNCSSYLACSGGITYFGSCPGNYKYDDSVKGCRETSSTCYECHVPAKCNSTGPGCITNCTGAVNGNHQICANCTSYAVCTDEQMSILHCPAGLYWDDNMQGCSEKSGTCDHCAAADLCDSTGEDCIFRCSGLAGGFYQSCTNCTSYVQCSGGSTRYHTCSPEGWLWDQGYLTCLPFSSTCVECEDLEPPPSDDKCNSTGPSCIRDCDGEPDGFRQICANCTSYAWCESEDLHVRHCPGNRVWDQNLVRCDTISYTCKECASFLEQDQLQEYAELVRPGI